MPNLRFFSKFNMNCFKYLGKEWQKYEKVEIKEKYSVTHYKL